MTSRMVPRETEVIVVGSGAVGSAMAAQLAEAGKHVLILEAGPVWKKTDLISSTLYARRLKWSGPPVLEGGSHPIGHAFNAGYGTGGSAMHHYAVWPRMHTEDFEMRSRWGLGMDWPITYSDLAPFYDRVQSDVGISGDAQREIWRPPGAAYPMPGVPVFAQGAVIARGFEKLGKNLAPLPLAVTASSYKGRPGCLWDGWCDAGCPIGALANPLTIHLPRALKAGATLVTDSPVVRVLTNMSGSRVTGVEVANSGGERQAVRADLVILAAFAVENPRLMLASATNVHPNGLGNTSGLLGKFFMTHSAGLIYGLFDENTTPHLGATGGQLLNQDSYAKTTHTASGGFGSYQWMIAQATKPNDLLGISSTRPDLFGPDLHRFMRTATQGFAGMTAVVEDLPLAENKVVLVEEKDRNGVPLAKVLHTRDPASQALWKSSVAEGKKIMTAAGAREVWSGPQGSMHLMGGTGFGTHRSNSVTNSFGQVHDIPNLVVAGPGLFPTSGGVNPTFTAHAIAVRACENLLVQRAI